MTDEAREAQRRYYAEWRDANREHIRRYHEQWRKDHPELVKAAQERARERRRERRELIRQQKERYWERVASGEIPVPHPGQRHNNKGV